MSVILTTLKKVTLADSKAVLYLASESVHPRTLGSTEKQIKPIKVRCHTACQLSPEQFTMKDDLSTLKNKHDIPRPFIIASQPKQCCDWKAYTYWKRNKAWHCASYHSAPRTVQRAATQPAMIILLSVFARSDAGERTVCRELPRAASGLNQWCRVHASETHRLSEGLDRSPGAPSSVPLPLHKLSVYGWHFKLSITYCCLNFHSKWISKLRSPGGNHRQS